MHIIIITLFPDFIEQYSRVGIIARAIKRKLLSWKSVDLRAFGLDVRKTVDDRPFGGGVGMVLRPDVLYKAISKAKTAKSKVVLLTPQGKKFDQKMAKQLSKFDQLVLVSGRYEGFDERVRKFVDMEISIGDYVLMGGELPALVISEAVLRYVPGVLGKGESADNESFSDGLLEYPQYTKPETLVVKGKKMSVPKVLRTGHHANIEAWRKSESLKRTKKRRPDLIK
jgi:tRNA (guanine37-N1)-methyltransferase